MSDSLERWKAAVTAMREWLGDGRYLSCDESVVVDVREVGDALASDLAAALEHLKIACGALDLMHARYDEARALCDQTAEALEWYARPSNLTPVALAAYAARSWAPDWRAAKGCAPAPEGAPPPEASVRAARGESAPAPDTAQVFGPDRRGYGDGANAARGEDRDDSASAVETQRASPSPAPSAPEYRRTADAESLVAGMLHEMRDSSISPADFTRMVDYCRDHAAFTSPAPSGLVYGNPEPDETDAHRLFVSPGKRGWKSPAIDTAGMTPAPEVETRTQFGDRFEDYCARCHQYVTVCECPPLSAPALESPAERAYREHPPQSIGPGLTSYFIPPISPTPAPEADP